MVKKKQTKSSTTKAKGSASTNLEQSIQFTGKAEEYFGIWLVNIILSVITLGIYSAWAKVRRQTYFKNNTKIGEHSFGYHATGWQILKGRLIVVAVLVITNILATFDPWLGIAQGLVFLFLIPWIINLSLRFSARMTSYRNIRFNWHGTYLKTLWLFMIAPILGVLTLGLAVPVIARAQYSYFANSHSYGTSKFACSLKVGEFYYAFLISALVSFVPAILFGLVIFSQVDDLSFPTIDIPISVLVTVYFSAIFFIYFMIFIYTVLCRNLMVRSLSLASVARFDSTINPFMLLWISLSNFVVIIISLGFMTPWAQIRKYRYLSHSTQIKIEGNLDKFVDEENKNLSSFGEGYADIEGLDIGI